MKQHAHMGLLDVKATKQLPKGPEEEPAHEADQRLVHGRRHGSNDAGSSPLLLLLSTRQSHWVCSDSVFVTLCKATISLKCIEKMTLRQ